MIYCQRKVQRFTNIYENYVLYELDEIEQQAYYSQFNQPEEKEFQQKIPQLIATKELNHD